MLQNAYGGQNISITTEEKTKTKSELKKAIQTAFADSDADDVNYFYYSGHGQQDGLCLEMGRSRENVVTPQDLYDCFAGIEGKCADHGLLLQRHDGFADQEHWAAESS